jgi:hypothetical protein
MTGMLYSIFRKRSRKRSVICIVFEKVVAFFMNKIESLLYFVARRPTASQKNFVVPNFDFVRVEHFMALLKHCQ